MNIGSHPSKTIISMVIILIIGSLIPILIVENLTTSLPNFISDKLLCIFCDDASQPTTAAENAEHFDRHMDFRILPFTNYVSGLFYGMFILGIAVSFTIYYIFKPLKWNIILPLQMFLLVLFIYADIINMASVDHNTIGNYLLTSIIIGLVLFLVYLITYLLKGKTQRFLAEKQYKIYSIAAAISLVFYLFINIFKESHSTETHLTFVILLLISQFFIHQSKTTKKLHNYILMLFSLIVYFAVCFTLSSLNPDAQNYQRALTSIKILSIPVLALSLVNAFIYLLRVQQQGSKNEILVSQYVMIVKNYHKLLLDEKKNQETKSKEHRKIEDLIIPKDHRLSDVNYLRAYFKFTEREVDVTKLVWEGLSNKDIAIKLNISISTTKYHLSNIYLKLNINSRSQLLILKN